MSLMTSERRSRKTGAASATLRDRRQAPQEPAVGFRPANLLAMAVWLGLATGLIELALLYARWRLVDATALSSVQLNQHALWMVPVSHAMVFGSCGLASAAPPHDRSKPMVDHPQHLRTLFPLRLRPAPDLPGPEFARDHGTFRRNRSSDIGPDREYMRLKRES